MRRPSKTRECSGGPISIFRRRESVPTANCSALSLLPSASISSMVSIKIYMLVGEFVRRDKSAYCWCFARPGFSLRRQHAQLR